MQSFLELDESSDQALINFLNASDKSSETLVLQFGSHSIKFGLASQMQPFMVPTIIAHPTKKQNLFTPKADQDQNVFEYNMSKVLPDIVNDLRQNKCHLIDDKAI